MPLEESSQCVGRRKVNGDMVTNICMLAQMNNNNQPVSPEQSRKPQDSEARDSMESRGGTLT